MALSVNFTTGVITVPQADLTLVSGTLYELDLDDLRNELRDIEGSEEGILYPIIHNHTPPATLGGVVFARAVEIINGYTIVFEDDQYGVDIVGGNSNIADVLVRNQVSVNTANSAGLVYAGFGADDRTDLNIIKRRTATLLGNA